MLALRILQRRIPVNDLCWRFAHRKSGWSRGRGFGRSLCIPVKNYPYNIP